VLLLAADGDEVTPDDLPDPAGDVEEEDAWADELAQCRTMVSPPLEHSHFNIGSGFRRRGNYSTDSIFLKN
jgi:hypothetical protein